ncbi:MAG TPA: SPFH domain-containing protein, partial [Anaerolineales bacterium]
MKKTRLSIILVSLFTGGSPWGYLRLLLGAGIVALFFFFERQGFSVYTNLSLTAMKDWWPRFLLVPLAAWLAVMMLGAYYVRDVYELPTFWMGLGYVVASLFGLGYPVLMVGEGKKKVPDGSTNLIERVGGPGYVAVKPGSAVLLERSGGPSHVFGAGPHFISTGEIIRETVSLEDQDGFIEKVPATTKDGIPILVHDVHFRFRLRAGKWPGDYTRRTPSDPYPFSQQALRQMAYLKLVRKDGPIPWRSTVQTAVEGVITEYITQHKLDSLTAPRFDEPDPRKEIEDQFQSSSVRSAMRAVGADLLWVDMGHFEVADKDNQVNEQRTHHGVQHQRLQQVVFEQAHHAFRQAAQHRAIKRAK